MLHLCTTILCINPIQSAQPSVRQTALERQNLSCPCLAHDELENVIMFLMIVTTIMQVMEWCEMPKADMDCLVSKESAAQIHVVFMGQGLQPEALEQRRLKGDYAKIVAFRPTG
jgi:hypothetical protein